VVPFGVMSSPALKEASYEKLAALPKHMIGEILAGDLYASPRPRVRHASTASTLGEELGPPFRRGRGGPGGWILLDEPELHLGGDILVPDLAGWRRSRMPEVPDVPHLELAPDWTCEVLSPSTSRIDRVLKRRIYARESVTHFWMVDPDARTLEVERLDGDSYRVILTASEDEVVRAEPFDAIELHLGLLWNG
jgi:Uma2 family endonuclease